MSLFYFNHADDAAQINKFFESKGASKLAGVPEPNTCKAGDVIFAHVADYQPWLDFASKNQKIYIIFTSRAPWQMSAGNNGSNVYYCRYSADALDSKERFLSFLDGLNKSEYNWELLSPEPFPPELVALYLYDIAINQNVISLDCDMGGGWDNVRSKALSQYKERNGETRAWNKGTGSSERIEAIKKIFRNCGQ